MFVSHMPCCRRIRMCVTFRHNICNVQRNEATLTFIIFNLCKAEKQYSLQSLLQQILICVCKNLLFQLEGSITLASWNSGNVGNARKIKLTFRERGFFLRNPYCKHIISITFQLCIIHK